MPASAKSLFASTCRLGLALRGDGHLGVEDIHHALDRGVNFLNWPGSPDALSRAVAGLGPRRKEVMVCVQFEARTAVDAERELDTILRELGTDYVDVLTFYYVEEPAEWDEIIGPGGAHEFCTTAKRAGRVRLIGVTSHQRLLAATMARSGLLDLLDDPLQRRPSRRGAGYFSRHRFARHPGNRIHLPALGALLRPTPDDPPGFVAAGADVVSVRAAIAVGDGRADGAGHPRRAG